MPVSGERLRQDTEPGRTRPARLMTEIPNFFTVEEAAEIVRIGRTLAYQQAARYEATGGAEGLPVVRIGRLLRVPRVGLEAWAGGTHGCPSVRWA